MYSYNDFERLFVRYKAEAVPAGISIQSFCHSNKVPYNLFEKWYKDTRHKIVPVQVSGVCSLETAVEDGKDKIQSCFSSASSSELHILVDIRMSNGIHFHQGNLSYAGLKRLIDKLEVLC